MAKKEKVEEKSQEMDASTLAEKLKKIQAESYARKLASAASRKLASDARRQTMNKKGGQSGGSVQGLETSFGKRIIS